MPKKKSPLTTKPAVSARRATRPARAAVRANRSLVRRVLMHPTVTFALLVLGVLLAGLTYRVAADSYTVHAVVEALPLQQGAVITSPVNNKAFTTKTISVSGTCPDDAYVKLTRNGAFSGVAFCQNGAFAIQTDLFVGVNDLQAQAYGITDQPGPATPVVRVTYVPPTTSSPTSKVVTPPATAAPLLLSSDYRFTVTTTAQIFEWNLQYHSDAAPYATHIDWGDGQKTTLTVPSDEPFKISHRYAHGGYYAIKVTGTDKYGRTELIQMVAYIKKPGDAATSGSILGPPASSGTERQNPSRAKLSWLLYAWPTYLIIMLMLFSFWLGERREYIHLVRHAAGHKRLRHG